jgi:hypothetical protein
MWFHANVSANIDWYLYTVRQEKNSVSGGRKWALMLATLWPLKPCDRNPKFFKAQLITSSTPKCALSVLTLSD